MFKNYFLSILGDPGADSVGEGNSKRAENMSRRKVKNGEKSSSRRSLHFFVPYFSARLDFPSPQTICPNCPWVSEDVFCHVLYCSRLNLL